MFRSSLFRHTTCFNTKSAISHSPLSLLRRPIHFQRPLAPQRTLATSSTVAVDDQKSSAVTEPIAKPAYKGPLALTFRRLKIFSISSFSLSCTLAPFMFIMESNLPISARVALASIAVGTSGISTALVGWCGKPYVSTLRRLNAEENGGAEGLEMTTADLFLQPRITRVYDPNFLIETKRAFAKWELAETLILPANKSTEPGQEETVAETSDKDGKILGRWIVKWGEGGEGRCHEVGNVIRHFTVHEELLN